MLLGISRNGWTFGGRVRFAPNRHFAIPVLIQGVDNPGWSGCAFNTLQACQAAASGTEAECLANPWYQAGANAVSPPTPVGPIGANDPLPVGPPPN